jgi:hypothetical protein
VSKGNGIHPIWSRDRKEISYGPGPGLVNAVSVTTRPAFSFTEPVPLSLGSFINRGPSYERQRDILPDGRFIGVVAAGQTPAGRSGSPVAPEIRVILNWFEDLKVRVPVGK